MATPETIAWARAHENDTHPRIECPLLRRAEAGYAAKFCGTHSRASAKGGVAGMAHMWRSAVNHVSRMHPEVAEAYKQAKGLAKDAHTQGTEAVWVEMVTPFTLCGNVNLALPPAPAAVVSAVQQPTVAPRAESGDYRRNNMRKIAAAPPPPPARKRRLPALAPGESPHHKRQRRGEVFPPSPPTTPLPRSISGQAIGLTTPLSSGSSAEENRLSSPGTPRPPQPQDQTPGLLPRDPLLTWGEENGWLRPQPEPASEVSYDMWHVAERVDWGVEGERQLQDLNQNPLTDDQALLPAQQLDQPAAVDPGLLYREQNLENRAVDWPLPSANSQAPQVLSPDQEAELDRCARVFAESQAFEEALLAAQQPVLADGIGLASLYWDFGVENWAVRPQLDRAGEVPSGGRGVRRVDEDWSTMSEQEFDEMLDHWLGEIFTAFPDEFSGN